MRKFCKLILFFNFKTKDLSICEKFIFLSSLLNSWFVRQDIKSSFQFYWYSSQCVKLLFIRIGDSKYMKKILVIVCLILCTFSIKTLPEYLGRGYNILIGNPFTNSKDEGFTNKYNPFTLSYDKSKTTSDGNYLIPDNSESLTLNDCSFNETRT